MKDADKRARGHMNNINRAYIESLPGFTKETTIHAGINAYTAICCTCKKRVLAGQGVRRSCMGPFSWVHKCYHPECIP